MSGFAELHGELAAVAARILAPSASAANHGDPAPPLDWSLAAGAGWLGLEVPEPLGGVGASFAETAVVLVELGRAAATDGLFGTVVLGIGALLAARPGPDRDQLLTRIAAGGCRCTVALDGGLPPGHHDPFRLTGRDDRARLRGRARFVIDAAGADLVLAVADGDDGPVLVAVEPAGLAVGAVAVVDGTRRFATVAADGATPTLVLPLDAPADRVLAGLGERAAAALACDSHGIASAMLDATVAYAGQRHQFGRPIGSFQAVKHRCADSLVTLALGRELLGAAVEALADPATAPDGEATRAVARAKSHVCGGAVEVAGAAMQLHGGIGYTWEGGIHVHLKRAILNRSLHGSPAEHRRRLGIALTGGQGGRLPA